MQVTGFGSRVVAGQLLHEAEFIECTSLAGVVRDVAPLFQCLLLAGLGGGIVAGKPLQNPEFGASPGLLVAVVEVAVQCLRPAAS